MSGLLLLINNITYLKLQITLMKAIAGKGNYYPSARPVSEWQELTVTLAKFPDLFSREIFLKL